MRPCLYPTVPAERKPGSVASLVEKQFKEKFSADFFVALISYRVLFKRFDVSAKTRLAELNIVTNLWRVWSLWAGG